MTFDDEPTEEELESAADFFDISDVVEDMQIKGRRKIILTFSSTESDFCLMKFYLSLKRYVDSIETEIGIMAENDQQH